MFTASKNIRHRRSACSAKSTAMLIAVLVMANLIAIAGLGATAHADDFPNVLRYAPMTWEKKAPAAPIVPQAGTVAATATAVVVRPVERGDIMPVAPELQRNVSGARTETAPTAASVAAVGHTHRLMVIALMSLALASMAGISMLMFRSLARDIAENDRKRRRF